MPLIEIKVFEDEFSDDSAQASSKPSRTRW